MRTEELICQSQAGDRQAAERLVVENSGLIWSVTKGFFGRGVEKDDLYQLACVGFLKAVEGFHTDYGTQFSTYAVPKIAGEIRRFLRDDGAVKVSRGIKERSASIKNARRELTASLGREPTVTELAQLLQLTPEEIAEAEIATAGTASLQRQSGEEGFTLEDVLSDTRLEEDLVEQLALREAIARLPERERKLICLRYFHGLTQENVARILGVSQVQISRLEKKTLALLRKNL